VDTLRAAVVILRVAEAGSFAGAARLVGRFEARHGARLFRRTTRTLSLTLDGERFLAEISGPALALAAAAVRLGAPLGAAGTVRVTAAASLAPTLLHALAPLLERHPALRMELALALGRVDAARPRAGRIGIVRGHGGPRYGVPAERGRYPVIIPAASCTTHEERGHRGTSRKTPMFASTTHSTRAPSGATTSSPGSVR
jgi:DNA-binding transcriptional LysR family regulator